MVCTPPSRVWAIGYVQYLSLDTPDKCVKNVFTSVKLNFLAHKQCVNTSNKLFFVAHYFFPSSVTIIIQNCISTFQAKKNKFYKISCNLHLIVTIK